MTTSPPLANIEPRLLRRVWVPLFGSAFWLGILLATSFTAMRAVGMLGPQRFFWLLPFGFIVMALTPLVFFRKEGRQSAGFRLPRQSRWIVVGMLAGAIGAALCYWLGVTLFGHTPDNWYISIRRAFPVSAEMANLEPRQIFWIISIPSMIFSPLGE